MQVKAAPRVLLHRVQLTAARTLLAGMLLAGNCAWALNPSLGISQYGHTAWKISDGFTPGIILAIAQTPDGYLWLGTEFGLYRFDGVHAVSWRPPTGEDLLSLPVHSLLTARDGTLWIGTNKGVASLKDGKLTSYGELEGRMVHSLLEDREGTIWSSGEEEFSAPRISTGLADADGNSTICAIRKSVIRCYGRDGSLSGGGWIVCLHEDRKGILWAVAKNGIWRWNPSSPKFYPLPIGPDYLDGIAEDDNGKLIVGMAGGIRRFQDGKTEASSLPTWIQPFTTRTMLNDSDGGLWVATYHNGLVHIHRGKVDVFQQADGLSGDEAVALFEDREKNLWVSTINGLDRFRDTAAAILSVKEGLSNNLARSVLADKDGSVWVATPSGLNRWREGQIISYDKRDGKLNGLAPTSLFQDSGGRIWVSTTRELGYLAGNRFVSVTNTYDGRILDISEDRAANIWMADQQRGLLHLRGSKLVERIPWAKLGHKDFALSLAADPLRGGLWIGFYGGGISYFAGGHIQKTYTAADGLGGGSVNNLRVEEDGTLWAATEHGLSQMKNGTFATLAIQHGLPCNSVHWMIRDDDRSFWMQTSCGLVQLTRADIDSWTAAADRNQAERQIVHPMIFGSTDGVRVHRYSYHPYSPPVTKTSDGKIWFSPLDGVSVIDPRHLPFNKLPPPVHIEQIRADGKAYAASQGLRLPPLVRDVSIDYTALSLVAPEKVHFRYKLEGQDRDWHEVLNQREVHYSNLFPRRYRFQVRAANNSGIWNEAGASLEFSVAPAYYQTRWFLTACAAAFLALLWALYRYWVYQLAREFNLRLDERVGERIRLARDLHDTLLQSFQGLMLRFQVVDELLPEGKAKTELEKTLRRADEAIAEGRSTVYDLRTCPATMNDLPEAVKALGEELATQDSAAFHLTVEGPTRDLHPIIRDELYRIIREALRNAFCHACAVNIETEITYGGRVFRVRIRDDGRGITSEILENGLPGHYGLLGMRERTRQIGGKMAVWSGDGNGTEIELSVPAPIAYSAPTSRSQFRLFRRKAG